MSRKQDVMRGVLLLVQVTADQLEAWSTDVNAYIAHEDEGSFETSVRISAAEVSLNPPL